MRGTLDRWTQSRESGGPEPEPMNGLGKLLVGVLFVGVAGCSANVELEPAVAPLPAAELASGLPTAVPPETQPGSWAIPFSYQFPEGTWEVGFHRYGLRVDCPTLGQASLAGEWREFLVRNEANVLDAPVYLRLGGLSTATLGPPNLQTIHPDQLTIALVTVIGVTEEQAAAAANSEDCEVVVGWDGTRVQELLPAQPFRP